MASDTITPTANFRWFVRGERRCLTDPVVEVRTLQQAVYGRNGIEWRDVPTVVDESAYMLGAVANGAS